MPDSPVRPGPDVERAAIVFPGQGAQTVGMAAEWVDAEPAARELFASAAEVLGYDLLAVCRAGPSERLNTTAVSQPAILVTSLAALEVLRRRDGHPLATAAATAGLSLGEYTALVFAGVIDFEAAVRLVHLRGRAMQECAERQPGVMLAVLGVDRERLVAVCDECRGGEVLEVANVLCPGNIVVSGSARACERLAAAAPAAGAIKCVPLEVAGAFHTRLMEPAVEQLSAALEETRFRPPRIPVVSNVDARPHAAPEELRSLLARQVVGVVEWQASMAYLFSTGVRAIWEVGPGRVLRGLVKRIDRTVSCHGVWD